MKRDVAAMQDGADEMIPPPPVLKRQKAYTPLPTTLVDMVEPDEAMVTRYLQYECNYRACKYRDPLFTWGEIHNQDYEEFKKLLAYHVPVTSNTFIALVTQLLPSDQFMARMAVRYRDTPTGQDEECNQYLNYKCTHQGRMNNKSWAEIRDTEYSYFVWAVGNTMGRETKTFNIMKKCLLPAHQKMVMQTEKGQVKVRKGLVYAETKMLKV